MPEHQPVIAILNGGPSKEAAVSRLSAGRIQGLMERHYDHIHVLELDCHIARELDRICPDVVFPLLHGPFGEDGTVQGLLDILGFPYVGSGVLASALAMDKHFTKQLLAPLGLNVAKGCLLHSCDGVDRATDIAIQTISFPMVIKPRSQGSTIAINAAEDRARLRAALEESFNIEPWALAEELIIGREVTVAILDHPTPKAMPVLEVHTSGNNGLTMTINTRRA